ncbi:hypothetical protein JZM24_01750 [Candidatus Sodalis endolongispinus]|uniref:Uncharacterized protein n=1 Tax=Candidatus Sodalis endolongispinus TaxID=2812662 RepID=A0ABS5YAP5_9GAMM|nr:hypothetical protein [Candidatus Sodalis endolongispinus]MBT9431201.1 hypothetical protein [Candidatus Sodalis endolongispinus]
MTINMTSDVCAQRHSDAGGDAGQPVGKVSVPTLPIECGGASRFCPPARLTRIITRQWKASSHAADAVARQLATLPITSCDRPQRRRLGYALTCMLLLSATQAVAEGTLTAQLTAFMQRQFTPAPLSLRVQVMTPAERRLTCAQPLFSLPARTRVMGNLSLRMVCGGQTRYLQVSGAGDRPLSGSGATHCGAPDA